jgi:hypothetical protein
LKHRIFLFTAFIVVSLLTTAAFAQEAMADSHTLAAMVKAATERYKDVEVAKGAGYGLLHGCVAGPEEGAMGIHYANGDLVGDGVLDAEKPEALLYESRNGRLQLTGVEYVVIAEQWNASHNAPPVLGGQLFNLVGSPNRYGLPAFYELHVWAWKTNPRGTFADFNPTVSCDGFTPAPAEAMHSH